MHEADDRLAGDLVWELFPAQAEVPRRAYVWMAILVIETWFLDPPLSILLACLAVAFRDFQKGHRLAVAIPDKAGGRICSLFTYAWGALKFAVTAFVLMFATLILAGVRGQLEGRDAPPEIPTAMVLWVAGFLGTFILTGSGLVKAVRSGMRVWLGEGINQARTLLLAMLVVAFSIVVIGPWCLWLVGSPPPPAGQLPGPVTMGASVVGFWMLIFAGPVGILIILDWMSRRVVAETPGKFGAKVPAVGKWDR